MDFRRETNTNSNRSSVSSSTTGPSRNMPNDSRSPLNNDMRAFYSSENSGNNNSGQGSGNRRVYGDRVAIDPRNGNGNTPNASSRPSVPRRAETDGNKNTSRRPVGDYGLQNRARPADGRPRMSADRQRAASKNSDSQAGEIPDFVAYSDASSSRSQTPSKRGSGGSGSGRPPGPPKRRKPKRKKRPLLSLFKYFMVFCLIIGALGSIGGFVYVQSVIKDTAPIDPSHLYDALGENSVILDVNGKVLETLQNEGVRKIIKYSEMDKNLIDAYVAVEDKTFWEHKGFNVVRLVGSVWQSFTKGNRIKGTSTITQQLARNIYLVETKSLRSMERKIKEAHYAIQLEKYLTKEDIIEAYLNTIYLGAGANGVEAASQAYFSKSAQDLDLVESAILAGIPAGPTYYTPMHNKKKEDVTAEDIVLDDSDDLYTIVYNKNCEKRYAIAIRLMYDNGKITKEEYEMAKNTDIVTKLKPSKPQVSDISSYFADMVKDDVIEDLMAKYDYTKSEAISVLYNKGLKIHSTVDYNAQKALEEAYESQKKNMPKITITFDASGNVINKDGQLMLYKYENIINRDEQFVIPSSDFKFDDSGNLTLLKGKRLNFYGQYENNELVGIQAVLKSVYKASDLSEKGIKPAGVKSISNFMTYIGKDLLIPSKYKTYDANKNLVISSAFLAEKPDFFTKDSRGYLLVNKDNYVMGEQGIVQPQSATVVIDYHTGALRAVVGGRNIKGQKIYNRAVNPRQPGSSIKPLAVYLPAIATKQFTAASVIDDAPTYLGPDNTRWPFNWYEGSTKYWGLQTIRESIEWSINVNAVKVAQAVGLNTSLEYLKKLGVTTVLESGSSNDMNLSAMALGGMTKGISPVEMTQAYGAIANNGLLVDTITYTLVEDRNGEPILENIPEKTQAVDEASAYIVLDMLKSTVTKGLAKNAAIYSGNTKIPVAGKTGTTSNKMDAWFVGASPYYSAAVWFGNDLNIPLDQGSKVSSQFWQVVMKKLHTNLPAKEFTRPATGLSDVVIDTKSGLLPSELSKGDPRNTVHSELFLTGTEPTLTDDVHVSVRVCKDSNKLATDNCPTIVNRVFVKRKVPLDNKENLPVRDLAYEAPANACDIHGGGGATSYKNPTIVSKGNGRYEVVLSFLVELLDGTKFSIPTGSFIQPDKSILLPDGSVIMPYDVNQYPDLKKLQGIPVTTGSPNGTPQGLPTDNPDNLLDQLDSAPPNN